MVKYIVGGVVLWFASVGLATSAAPPDDDYRMEVKRQIEAVQRQRVERETQMAEAVRRRREAERSEAVAQVNWESCSRRRGIQEMDDYVVDIGAQRRAAAQARRDIEVLRVELRDSRRRLEVTRDQIERPPRDAQYLGRLMDDYITPMRGTLDRMEDTIDLYEDYVIAATIRQNVFIHAGDHCSSYRTLTQHLIDGLRSVVDATERLLSAVAAIRGGRNGNR